MFQYICHCEGNYISVCGGGIGVTWKDSSFLFFLPPIFHASSSVVVNKFSSAEEQSSGNQAQLGCLTSDGKREHLAGFVKGKNRKTLVSALDGVESSVPRMYFPLFFEIQNMMDIELILFATETNLASFFRKGGLLAGFRGLLANALLDVQ